MKTKNNNLEKLGKRLSYVLRHDPASVGVTADRHGWVAVDAFLTGASAAGRAFTLAQLHQVVATNNKKRYAFNAEGTHIRALQGHTYPVDLGLENQKPPTVLYHGTATRYVESILQSGVQRQRRHAVHLSASAATAVSVGARHGKPVVLRVDASAMHAEGYHFQCTANGVWLTDHVPAKFLQRL